MTFEISVNDPFYWLDLHHVLHFKYKCNAKFHIQNIEIMLVTTMNS